jgi:hypothetical protein
MFTLSKINANRANAKFSTGPKTTSGRLRSSKNARRHGLSTPVLLDPVLAEEVKTLALQLIRSLDNPCPIEAAYCLAEAEIDLKRIRKIKHDLLDRLNRTHHPFKTRSSKKRSAPNSDFSVSEKFEAGVSDLIEEMLLIDRYERRALARRKSAIRQFTIELQKDYSDATENRQNEAKNINDFKGGVTIP